MGVIGVAPSDFWNMTPRETAYISEAYYKRERAKSREQWELARYNAYFGLLPHQGKHKQLKLTDLGLFEWERRAKKESGKISQEDLETLKKWEKEAEGRLLTEEESEKLWR